MFLVAAGLSLIFGVTRVVNFAHGSFYMLGIYLAWTFTGYFGGGAGYCRPAAGGAGHRLIGAAAERLVLSRLYGAPELFQLLATFALLLIIGDATLALWGPEDLFSARAPASRARSRSWAAATRNTTCCSSPPARSCWACCGCC